MATDETGDILYAPHYAETSYTTDDELLYSTARFTQKGCTLAVGQGILPVGTVMGRVTATKLWKVYNNALSDGTEVARGVLRKRVNTGVTGDVPKQANIVISGILKSTKVSGADAAALVDLAARIDSVLGIFVF